MLQGALKSEGIKKLGKTEMLTGPITMIYSTRQDIGHTDEPCLIVKTDIKISKQFSLYAHLNTYTISSQMKLVMTFIMHQFYI